MIQVRVTVHDADEILTGYSAGALIRLYRAATEDGVYSEVGSGTAVVSGTSEYTIWDASGTSTSWYKTRYSNAGGTEFSDYSAAEQCGTPQAYATLEELRQVLPVTDATQFPLMRSYLADASAFIDGQLGFDFYRHPATSTETRYFDVEESGRSRLVVYGGLVSVTTVSMASYSGGSYTDLAAADWYLRPKYPEPGGTYTALELSDQGSYRSWYAGYETVKIVGAFGWSDVPDLVRRATLELARMMYRAADSPSGSALGADEYGRPIMPHLLPQTTYRCIERYRGYFGRMG